MFERTAAGQSNRTIFYDVDIVAYVEGGGAFDVSFDRLFWSLLFRSIRPDLNVHCVPRGSKQDVLALAKETEPNATHGVYFCLDADYDVVLGRSENDPRILYTYGYSFETDVFNPDTVFECFWRLVPVCPRENDARTVTNELYEEFQRDVRWLCRADLLGYVAGQCPIDRRRPNRYLKSAAYSARPELSKRRAYEDVTATNAATRGRQGVSSPRTNLVPRYVVGHLAAAFGTAVVTYLHSRFSRGPKLTGSAVLSTAITAYASVVAEGDFGLDATHYRRLLVGVVA